jgi:PAX-interacting protein 1
MDGANSRPTQGADPAAVAGVDPNAPAGGDWRTQLQPEARSRIVKKMYAHPLPSHHPLRFHPKIQFFPSIFSVNPVMSTASL